MEFKDLKVKHPYYCNDNNYYSNDAREVSENWEDFISRWGDADVEYNHVFRFDIQENENDEGIGQGTYYAEIFIMLQRKGKFVPVVVNNVKEQDKDSIIEFLQKHYEEVKRLWEPFS